MYRRIAAAIALVVAGLIAGAPLASAAGPPTTIASAQAGDPGPPAPHDPRDAQGRWQYHGHWNHDDWDDDGVPSDFCQATIVIDSDVYCDVDVDAAHR